MPTNELIAIRERMDHGYNMAHRSQSFKDVQVLLNLVSAARVALLGVRNKMGCWCVTPFYNISEERGHEPRCTVARNIIKETAHANKR